MGTRTPDLDTFLRSLTNSLRYLEMRFVNGAKDDAIIHQLLQGSSM